MASAISQLAGAPLANLLVIAGLVCIAISIFGWARETIAASSGFRAVSGLIGVLLLFCIYGIYLPRSARSGDPEMGRDAQAQSAPTQQAGAARQGKPFPQQRVQSTQPAAQSSSSIQQQTMSASQQQQSSQPFPPQTGAQDLFSGRWKNADPKAANILFLKVEERGGDEITVHAWGMCASQYCDWGTGHGVVRDGAATITLQQGAVLRRMKLEPDGGTLRVVLDSTSRGRPQHFEAHFAKSL